MSKKPITGLVFKLAKPKKPKKNLGSKLSNKVYCVCDKSEDGQFKAHLRIISNTQRITTMVIHFTIKSYDLKGKEKVFTKQLNEYGKRTLIYRDKTRAMLSPSRCPNLIPFCEGWVYSGYIVRIHNQMYFDIVEPIWHKDFIKFDIEIKEDDIKI